MKFATLLLILTASCALAAESTDHPAPQKLTLAEAESLALRYAPKISEAYFNSEAAKQDIRKARAALFPQVEGVVSLVGTGNDITNHDTTQVDRIGASGGLNNPSVYSRESQGFLASQLLTDFGRTSDLISAARYASLSEQERARLARAQVILLVDETYFKILGAQSFLRVANETVAARQLTVDQVSALTKSKLKSELDLSFAKVDLANASLLVLQGKNAVDQAQAELSAALGYREVHQFALADESQYPEAQADIQPMIIQALEFRPELVALRDQVLGANKFTAAERAARWPVVTAMGTIGRTPLGDAPVMGNYSAAGINVEMPIFDGGMLAARYQQAALKAKAAGKAVQAMEDEVAKEVDEAWLDALTAQKKIQVSKELLANAQQAFDLAQSRYKLGLSSIIELSQAQLNKTQAEIGYASAQYDYQIDRVRLEFDTGALKYRTPIANIR